MLSLLLRRVSPALTLSACRVPKPRPWTVSAARDLHATSRSLFKSFPPRPKPPPDSEIEESYLKGSGPGGQKIVRLSPLKGLSPHPPNKAAGS
jgi:hypothetical protein